MVVWVASCTAARPSRAPFSIVEPRCSRPDSGALPQKRRSGHARDTRIAPGAAADFSGCSTSPCPNRLGVGIRWVTSRKHTRSIARKPTSAISWEMPAWRRNSHASVGRLRLAWLTLGSKTCDIGSRRFQPSAGDAARCSGGHSGRTKLVVSGSPPLIPQKDSPLCPLRGAAPFSEDGLSWMGYVVAPMYLFFLGEESLPSRTKHGLVWSVNKTSAATAVPARAMVKKGSLSLLEAARVRGRVGNRRNV